MKKLLILMALVALPAIVLADEYVSGYYKRDGTYVPGYYRSSPNQYKWDNYGSRPSSERGSYWSSPYTRDSDKDGLYNQYDRDDNNNGISDDSENKRRW